MRLGFFILSITLLSTIGLTAQQATPAFCATPALDAEQLVELRQIQKEVREQGEFRGAWHNLPIHVHIVGRNDGTGYYPTGDVYRMLCELNEQYVPVEFRFFLDGISWIDNSTFYEHNNGAGLQMMQQNNKQNVINVYMVGDPAGACGYMSYQGNAVAIKNSCAEEGNTTVAHEIGHFFGLPHTFSGWENGQTPPANEQELVDGTNCQDAGDGFCDTDPDYVSYRWGCPYSGPDLFDPKGQQVFPDERNYMSYASDECSDRFSPSQRSLMQYVLTTYRSGLTGNSLPAAAALATPELTEPADGAVDQPSNNTLLRWDAVPGATSYYVVVSRFVSFAVVSYETVVTTNAAVASGLTKGVTYRWKVLPIAENQPCGEYSDIRKFTAGEVSSIGTSTSTHGINIFPNPAASAEQVSITFDLPSAQDVRLEVISVQGRVLQTEQLHLRSGATAIQRQWGLPAGSYLIRISGNHINELRRLELF